MTTFMKRSVKGKIQGTRKSLQVAKDWGWREEIETDTKKLFEIMEILSIWTAVVVTQLYIFFQN